MFDAERSGYKPTFLDELCRYAYTLALTLIIPIIVTVNFVQSFRDKDKNTHRGLQRFGVVPKPKDVGGYLVHCVSVGEVVAASCLIKRIKQDTPHIPVTITTTTVTGAARVKALFGESVQHFYLPYDLPVVMSTMLSRIQPKTVLITEVELWPNLIHACWKKQIACIVVNARMTDRSAKRYNKLSKLFRPMVNKLSLICAQGQRDFDNYLRLGAAYNQLTLTNNIKFDQVASARASQVGFMGLEQDTRPVIVAGSTHDPEEEILISAMNELWQSNPHIVLVIVPRHPQRFDIVASFLEESSVPFVRSSQAQQLPINTNVILVDEMGRLNDAYSVAYCAFVGGSIANRGGHNALEPAAFSTPILMGPHTYNNPEICAYLKACGALQSVTDAHDIANWIRKWIDEPESHQEAGLSAKKVLSDNSGAVEKTLRCIININK